jgi:hypothetical protein
MKDLFTTLGIDVTVLCLVIFGDIEALFKIILLAVTIVYTLFKLLNEYKKYENSKNEH